jgi:hypothetical protein
MPKMARLASTLVLFTLATTVANAQAPQSAPRQAVPAAQIHTNIPANSVTVTHWYKQNVYDPGDNKIGEIMDVLVDREGKATGLIIGVGGFLGRFRSLQLRSRHDERQQQMVSRDEFHQRCSEECEGIQIRPDQHDMDAGGNPGDHGQPEHIRA